MSNRSIRGARVCRFSDFELDVRAGELRQGGEKIRLQEQPFRILAMLLECPGDVVLREEICKRLWPNGTVVEVSHGINAAVLRLRNALGDNAEDPLFVETVARRGYRFRAHVEVEFRRSSSSHSAGDAFDSSEISSGQSIAHYRIEDKLGRGAMGVVYRADDLNLGRPVALKFLAPEMAGDPSAVNRFHRESRTASALNHPNICTVYSVEEFRGQPVIVMELLEGRTLESLLSAGPLPAARAVPLALQMAAALEAAHRKGIVHRDLKPANVIVTEFGVKVLDFGLAKCAVTDDCAAVREVTQAGSIAGTPNYMAPELFLGQPADARSDLYALGAVLLEMLTGSRDARSPRAKFPEDADALEPIVRRALRDDPAERWQTAGDFKAALECAGTRVTPVPIRGPRVLLVPSAASERFGRRLSTKLVLAAAGLAGLALITSSIDWSRWRAPAPRTVDEYPASRTVPLPTPPGPASVPPSSAEPAYPAVLRAGKISIEPVSFSLADANPRVPGHLTLSPDGRSLAYSNADDIYVRSLDSGDTRLVTSVSGRPGTPFWSPDGKSIAFPAGGHLYTAPAKGGSAKQLAPINTNMSGAWGIDGTILIGEIRGGIIAIPSDGNSRTNVTTPDPARGETRHLLPQFLPGGKRFLYTAGSDASGSGMLYASSLDGSKPVPLLQVDSGTTFVPRSGSKGYLVFTRGTTLLAQAFDAAALRVEGAPVRLAGPIRIDRAAAATALSASYFSATTLTLVYRLAASATQRSLATLASMGGPVSAAREPVIVKNWMAMLTH
ncbi:MAG TPA: protein kinase [Bryobacteraceae bacterium]|nr:protein kinase [Bryobacteraceae bacterium]